MSTLQALLKEVVRSSDLIIRDEVFRALIRCLTPTEACNLCFDPVTDDHFVRAYLLRKIAEDAALDWKDCHSRLVERLLDLIRLEKGKTKIRSGASLSRIIEVTPPALKSEIIAELLWSESRAIRKQALKHLRRTWISSLQDEVLRSFHKYGDLEGLDVLIRHAPVQLLMEHWNAFAQSVAGSAAFTKLFMRLAPLSEEHWAVLKTLDPVTYLYVATKQKKAIPETDLLDIYLAARWSDKRSLVIWCIGVIGLPSLLEHIIEIERNTSPEEVAQKWLENAG